MDKTPLNYALAYAALDWKVFPCWWVNDDKTCGCGNTACKNVGKHPISELAPKGQNSATTDKDMIAQWWGKYPQANIAIFLAGSGLCAVDIDPRNGGDYTIEVLESEHGKIDSDVLQLTGGGGEHRVFLLPSGDVKLPGTLGKGVDFKSNGYIIAEPSSHISGQSYVWEMSSDPLAGAVPSPLPDWIRSFNINAAHASNETGTLHNGMSENQYYDVLEALQFIGSDDRDTWLNVGMALQASGDKRAYQMWCDWSQASPKFDQNDQYRVWRSFKGKGLGSIDLPTIFKLAQDNGWVNSNTKVEQLPVIEIAQDQTTLEERLAKKHGLVTTPKELLSFPINTLNAVMLWMESYTREPQRQITMQGVLALASVLGGRKYQSQESNTTSMYLLVLGETGIGKNYIKEAIQIFLEQSNLDNLLSGSGNTSSGAVFTALRLAPCHIQITDEMGKHLQTARKQQNGQIAEGLTAMVEAYSSTTSIMVSKNYSNPKATLAELEAAKTIIKCPAITQLGMATPGQVYENLTTKEIEDGFLNRLIVVDISEPLMSQQATGKLDVPEELKEWALNIRKFNPKSRTDLSGIETDHKTKPNMDLVVFEDGALELFDNQRKTLREREAKGEFSLPDLTRRWRENAMRMATTLAVCENSDNPVITVEIAQWCIKYVEYYGQLFMDQVTNKVADSDFHRLSLAIMDLVTRAGDRGMTERDLSKNSRLFAATAPNHREQAFKALLSEERIIQVAINTVTGRGRKRSCFILPEYFNAANMVATEQNN